MSASLPSIHWADMTADRIIREKGDKDVYTLASGITPSGTVHFGNFREVITVDLVARALRRKGKTVRFIFSWDDYDTFRKIPKNMPKQEELEKYLFNPIVDTPDPYGNHESYARHHEDYFESQIDKVGIEVEFLYQAKKYRAKTYNDQIKLALDKRDVIAAILSEHRKEPLGTDWFPVLVYCTECNRDRITVNSYDGKTLGYECNECGHKGEEDVLSSERLKLPWRVDWPMRWAFEKVDFEPGGKDHSSQGGSYTTAKEIVKQIYDHAPPVYLQYDFVSIKGGGGKMSSSSGEVVTVNDVLDIYEPEMIRWIFASYKSNVDFSVSFDLDVIKNYEDFDRMERMAYGLEKANDKKLAMAKRVYELSQIEDLPESCPFQPSFRHLCNLLQINDGDLIATKKNYKDEIKTKRDERRFEQRAKCALFWIENYAPEDFKFQIHKSNVAVEMEDKQKEFIVKLSDTLDSQWDSFTTDKELHEKMYEIIHEIEIKPNEVFPLVYQKLIGRDRGPKLAGFIRIIGKDRVLSLLR